MDAEAALDDEHLPAIIVMSQPDLLSGKTAVVTGGTRGIGRAVADLFLDQGACVIALGREGPPSPNPKLEFMACDVADEDSVVDTFLSIGDRFGGVDILVNCAGISLDATTHRMSVEQFREVLDVNLTGAWMCSREAIRMMRAERRAGCIVNISSLAGKAGNYGQANYAASKAGMVAMTKSMARENAVVKIRVNCIRPGLIRTDMTKALPSLAFSRLLNDVPMGRPGEPAEVAHAVLFLASDMSTYVTGAVLDVGGGRHM